MKRLVLAAVAPLLLSPLGAQSLLVSTRVSASPCGSFYVDGVLYSTGQLVPNAVTFLWPENSKHVIEVTPGLGLADEIRCMPPSGWTDQHGRPLGPSPLVFTANRDITEVNAVGAVIQYLLRVDFYSSTPPPPGTYPPPGPWPGIVTCSPTSTTGGTMWLTAGSGVSCTAYPSKGFVFTGWGGGAATSSQAFVTSFTMDGPKVVTANFEPAVPVKLLTIPDGFKVLADRQVITSGTTLDWQTGSQHTLSPVSPQNDPVGATWVFDSWSNGGDEIQTITAPPTSNDGLIITAKYVPGVRVGFVTSPLGLKLAIDGRTIWPNYNFVWKAGSQHTAAAPLEQTDAHGRKYMYRSWSVEGGNEITVTVPTDGSSTGYRATYDIEGQLNIQGPAGAWVLVDGTKCMLPCVVDRPAGTTVHVSAAASVDAGDASRLAFQGWADGGPAERQWTAGTDVQTIAANYQISYRLMTAAEPEEGGSLTLQPASTDGYYASGTNVTLTAKAAKGYRLLTWEGDLTGKQSPATVNVSGPMVIRAKFEKAPVAPPVGVRNAAGDTPDSVVAPGSIITIYGANLAAAYEKGPDSPLSQVVGGVVVSVGDRLLPLFFVSPEQINAQLPSDLAEGDYTLTVRPQAMAEVSVGFTVRRNAPGLFNQTVDTKDFAVATHSDGSNVSMDSPASRGETITLSGTGFGPYQAGSGLLDGFAAPSSLAALLEDPVQIVFGDRVITPVSVQAAPGLVGVTILTLKVGDDWPQAATIELKARVNGRDSNSVLLPLR